MWSNIFLAIFIVLLFVTLLVFKHEISNLLNSLSNILCRAKKMQYKSMNIVLGEENIVLSKQQDYTSMKKIEYSKAYQSSMATAEEQLIREQLLSAGITNEHAVDILIYQLAHKNLYIKLLVIDRLIFKEQIQLLLFLNKQFKPQPENILFNFYQEWFEQNKKSDYKFAGFLNFLLQERLIMQSIDGYSIGEVGKEYLSFLIKIGAPLTVESPKKSQESAIVREADKNNCENQATA